MKKVKNRKTLLEICLRFIRAYRKNTLALLLSFILTISLIVSIFTLLHTNQQITEKQNLFIYTAMDYEINELNAKQIKQLENDPAIEHLGLSREVAKVQTAGNQRGNLVAANPTEILTVSTMLKGRMPKKSGEIVAEKWTLLNLGLHPTVGQKFKLPIAGKGKEAIELELVGIINDLAFNKRSASLTLYTFFDFSSMGNQLQTARFAFKPGVDKEHQRKELQRKLGLHKKQFSPNVWKSSSTASFLLDLEIGILLLVVCLSIVYGIYRVALMTRKNQYGIFRAIGLTKNQIRQLVIYELFLLFFAALPLGVLLGWGTSHLVTVLSKDQMMEIFFWGKADRFDLVIPYLPIAVCLLAFVFALLLIGLIASKIINKEGIIETIFNSGQQNMRTFSVNHQTRIPIAWDLARKYIAQDIRTTIYIIVSLTIGSCLFMGLLYQSDLANQTQQIKIDTDFFSSDFIMSTNDDRTPNVGITQKTLKKICAIGNVNAVETQSALPIQVRDTGLKRNISFIDQQNKNIKKSYGFELHGKNHAGKEVYRTKLKGYNAAALKKLQNYWLKGTRDFSKLKENEVIVAMPTTSESGRSKDMVGFFKNGRPIMDYQINDSLKISYREDLNTADPEYWTFSDMNQKYIDKHYKIASIVYYTYMPIVSQLEQIYPLLITSETHFKNVIPKPAYETINLHANPDLSKKGQTEIENQLIHLAVKNQNVTARSMIDEKEQLYSIYHKERVYVFGIAFVVFILAITNLINSLKYRIETRKRELFLFKAIGMTYRDFSKIILLENIFFVAAALLITIIGSSPIMKALYQKNQMYLLGKSYQFPFLNYLVISGASLIICLVVSSYLTGYLKKTSILEEMNRIE
ncbi:FtsX-like permease family protein [Enterococcus hulanensis]|uniref:ABC transporter permease n=1 Tax=Enterococcus TaxID=1350 RepID=UPI000B6CA1C5|nr:MULTISPECIES: ABC transporter permease [Enterococcus]MBO0410183.1 FtsX-like permease family protein [Enterococcus hulanensis]OTO14650.1 hypothetical protein A5875_003807 [Enterococcus sp. 3H8_DIV0648]